MQVKIFVGQSYEDLETKVNEFLGQLPEDPKSIQFDLDNWSAIVEYDRVVNAICCECKNWDAEEGELMGLCQKRGCRKRFSNKSCKDFDDIRG